MSIKVVSLFHEAPADGTWELSLRRGGGGGGGGRTFLNKAENTTCLIIFFFRLDILIYIKNDNII